MLVGEFVFWAFFELIKISIFNNLWFFKIHRVGLFLVIVTSMALTKKFKAMALSILIASSVGLVACQPKLDPEADCNFVMSSQIQRVSWKGKFPVKLYISQDVPIELRESIRIAASQWNYKLNKEALLIYEADNIPQSPEKDGVNGIYWQTSWNDGKATEQARTTIFWKGDTINEADVLVNAKDHMFSSFGSLEPSKIDFTSLMVHELGHVLGLQHVQSEPSVMAPTLSQSTARIVPTELDVNSLKCEYN